MRTAARWAVPPAVAAVVLAGAAFGPAAVSAVSSAASADDAPAPTTAAQLLTDLASAKPQALSGTVTSTTDLGLPSLPTTGAGSMGAGGAGDLADLLAGTTTARVWTDGAQRSRLAVLGHLAETDVVRDGRVVTTWRSGSDTVTRAVLPAGAGASATPSTSPAGALPTTPAQAAQQVLAAVDPTTAVSLGGTEHVAGREARLLVVEPRDAASLVGRVVVAVDERTSVPLRVQVVPRGASDPALSTGFTAVSFSRPSAAELSPALPSGAKVHQASTPAAPSSAARTAARPTVVGSGWTSVLVWHDTEGLGALTGAAGSASGSHRSHGSGADDPTTSALLQAARPVSGSFGSGRLLTTSLVSVLALDDGRLLVGAVGAPALERAALAPAAQR